MSGHDPIDTLAQRAATAVQDQARSRAAVAPEPAQLRAVGTRRQARRMIVAGIAAVGAIVLLVGVADRLLPPRLELLIDEVVGEADEAPDPAPPAEDDVSEPEGTGGARELDEAVALASAYMEARNAYDVEGARQLVADEFRTDEPPDGYSNLATMEPAFELVQAFGFHFSEVECVPLQGTVTRLVVQCAYLQSSEMHRTGGHAPTPAEVRVYVKDGRIAEVLVTSAPDVSWWGPFRTFVREHDLAFSQVMDGGLALEPEAQRELMERLPEFFQRYEQWLDEQDDSSDVTERAEQPVSPQQHPATDASVEGPV
jgi:hypothetical protein